MRNDLIEEKILFSEDECDYIKTLFKDDDFKRSMVISHSGDGGYSNMRTSNGLLLDFNIDKKNIISSKLRDIGIYGKLYTFSVLRYDVGQEFKKHRDNIGTFNKRFKTVIIQLSSETEYEGGELIIHNNGDEIVASKKLGNTIVFHSSLEHQVEKITSGRRYSIVFWIGKGNLNINNSLI